VAKAAEIVAERWTPLVLRELLCGSRRFADLHRGLPLMSRALLVQRLHQLEHAGIVRSMPKARGRGREYTLTPAGQELRPVIEQLGEWGQRWARSQLRREELDPGLLVWDIHRRLNVDRLPERRVVVRFEFHGTPRASHCPTTWWLVLQRPEVDVCLKEPGFEEDLVVHADVAALTKVWMGDVRLSDAMRQGLVRLEGLPMFRRAFPGWLALSSFAPVPRAGATSPT
jgi:DNA-binding HxlR family transcriptional regulator